MTKYGNAKGQYERITTLECSSVLKCSCFTDGDHDIGFVDNLTQKYKRNVNFVKFDEVTKKNVGAKCSPLVVARQRICCKDTKLSPNLQNLSKKYKNECGWQMFTSCGGTSKETVLRSTFLETIKKLLPIMFFNLEINSFTDCETCCFENNGSFFKVLFTF